jgi:hypothetical protein
VTSAIIGLWQPQTIPEVQEVRHYAGLYQAGVVEVWDEEHLDALLTRYNATLVVLELDTHAVPLQHFTHPENALYLLGPLNGSVPRFLRDRGRIVQVEVPSKYPLRPSVAGAIVMHDRYVQHITPKSELPEWPWAVAQ